MEKIKRFENDDHNYKCKILLTDDHNLDDDLYIKIKFTRYHQQYHNTTLQIRFGFNKLVSRSATDGEYAFLGEDDDLLKRTKMFSSNTSTEFKRETRDYGSRTEVHPEVGEEVLEFLEEHLERKGEALVYGGGQE